MRKWHPFRFVIVQYTSILFDDFIIQSRQKDRKGKSEDDDEERPKEIVNIDQYWKDRNRDGAVKD